MITIDKEQKTPLYIQIYNAVRNDILSGNILPGEMLPSSRNLADTLNVSRNTVNTAYSQLIAEGYADAVNGCGYKVCPLSPDIPRKNISSAETPRSTETAKKNMVL